MVALILAAGYATRLYPYTVNAPKPLLPVQGKPIIDYILEQIMTLPDIKDIFVVTNNKFYSQFEEWREKQNNCLIKVINDGSNSVDDRLGAIGDITLTIDKGKIDDDIIIIAGDNLFTFKLIDYYKYFLEKNKNCVCVKEINDVSMLKNFGVCQVDENLMLTGFVEKPEIPPSNKAVFATYMFKRDTIKLINEYLDEGNKRDAPGFFIEWLHKKTPVYAYVMDGECYDIGSITAYESIRDTF